MLESLLATRKETIYFHQLRPSGRSNCSCHSAPVELRHQSRARGRQRLRRREQARKMKIREAADKKRRRSPALALGNRGIARTRLPEGTFMRMPSKAAAGGGAKCPALCQEVEVLLASVL